MSGRSPGWAAGSRCGVSGIGRQHRAFHDRPGRRRDDVDCSAVGAANWLADLIGRGMHHGVAPAAFHRDGLRLGGDQLARQRLLVGAPIIRIARLRVRRECFCGFGFGGGGMTVSAPQSGHFSFLPTFSGRSNSRCIANAAVEPDVLRGLARVLAFFGQAILPCRSRLIGAGTVNAKVQAAQRARRPTIARLTASCDPQPGQETTAVSD